MIFKRDDHGFQSRSFFGILMSPFRAIQDWIGDTVSGDDSFRDGQGNFATRLITLPFRLLGGFIVFMVQAWTTSRNGIAFLRGLPAFAILAGTPFLVWGLNNYVNPISLGPTTGYHNMHLRNEAYDNALLFSRKLVDLKPESKEYKYLLAEDLDRVGDNAEATRIMQYLAGSTEITEDALATDGTEQPTETVTDSVAALDEPERFAKAHVWLSQQLIRKQRLEEFDDSRNIQAMEHLRAAIDADPENIRAKVNLVDLYLTRARSGEEGSEANIENLKLAKQALESLTAPENFSRMEQVLAMPQLVNVCVQLGDETQANSALNNASLKVMRIARLNPEIYEIWFSLVQCAVALKEYDQAKEFIRTGYQNAKTQETRRRIMQLASLVYIQNADDFLDTSVEEQFRLRLFALCEAITTNPRDVKIYDRLVEYLDVDVDPQQRDVWLRNSIQDCPIPGVVHILIGTRELLRGDVVGGKTSWDIAQHQFGTTEFVIHRLLSVAIRKEPRYGEGNLLDAALLLFPDQYMLYETRGAIQKNKAGSLLVQQGKRQAALDMYNAAIRDFKIVLEKVPDLITVHKHLKDCYEKIGDSANMAIHAQRVEELLDQVEQKQRELYEKVLNQL